MSEKTKTENVSDDYLKTLEKVNDQPQPVFCHLREDYK